MTLNGRKQTYPRREKKACQKLREALGQRLKSDVILAPYTTFGIGGKADLFYRARTPDELVYAIGTAQKSKVNFLVLGGGSNLLVSDSGFRGLVIENVCRHVIIDQNTITCQSGTQLHRMVNEASNSSLAGLEFAAGIPGTVGGAIRGNAGAFGKAVGDVLTQAVILTRKGQIKEVDRNYFRFGYRDSILKRSEDTVLSASFKLEEKNKRLVKKQIAEYLERRKKNLTWKEKSAGCYFKNIVRGSEKIPAGLLLDQIGAKGMQVGGIRVSDRHANILINVKHGKSADVKKLSSILKRMIKTKFNINLIEEVVYIS